MTAADADAPSLNIGISPQKGEPHGAVSLTIPSELSTSAKNDWREVPQSHFVIASDGAFTEEPFTPSD